LMEHAVEGGTHLIALPENFSFLGPEGEKVKIAEDLDTGPSIKFLTEFASNHGVAIIGGSIPLKTKSKSKVSNTCLVIDQTGRIIARYDKLHLFDVCLNEDNTHEESSFIEAGNHVVTTELFGHVMGLSICYDLRFPELYRDLTLQGAKVLFVPSAFTVHTGKDHWEVLLRTRAIENQCYVVAPAQFGQHFPGRITYGRTMIVDPWGQILGQCQDKEDVVLCDINLDFLDDIRRKLPCLEHVQRKRFFSSHFDE
ncbi:MAG: carbon-nitrogen hydrolase family protein, partial [Thermodesulfobacteriota bacterium]